MNAGSGMIQLILRRIFPETTFVIAFASGAEPAPGRLRFEVRQSSPGLRLLLAARWFGDHGHWDPAAPDRQWDFPENFQPAELQVEIENFLCGCAGRHPGGRSALPWSNGSAPARPNSKRSSGRRRPTSRCGLGRRTGPSGSGSGCRPPKRPFTAGTSGRSQRVGEHLVRDAIQDLVQILVAAKPAGEHPKSSAR